MRLRCTSNFSYLLLYNDEIENEITSALINNNGFTDISSRFDIGLWAMEGLVWIIFSLKKNLHKYRNANGDIESQRHICK